MWIPTRPRVHIQNVPVCTGTTCGCSTHGDVLNVHTPSSPLLQQTTHTQKKKENETKKRRNHRQYCLPKFAHKGYHVPRRFTKETDGSQQFENRATSIIERSTFARTKQEHSSDKDHQQDDRDTRRGRDGKVLHKTTKRQEHSSKRRHHHTTQTHPIGTTTRTCTCTCTCRCSCTCRCLPSL